MCELEPKCFSDPIITHEALLAGWGGGVSAWGKSLPETRHMTPHTRTPASVLALRPLAAASPPSHLRRRCATIFSCRCLRGAMGGTPRRWRPRVRYRPLVSNSQPPSHQVTSHCPPCLRTPACMHTLTRSRATTLISFSSYQVLCQASPFEIDAQAASSCQLLHKQL